MCFNLHEVELEGELFYDDDDKRQITSVYLKYNGEAKKENKINKKHQKAMDSLILALETVGKSGDLVSVLGFGQWVVSLSEWRPFFNEDKELAGRRQNFSELRKALIEQGLIAVDGDYTWVV
jgi:hypothetical protein